MVERNMQIERLGTKFENVGRDLDKVERDIEEHVKKYGDPDAKKKKGKSQKSGIPQPKTKAEYEALPSGTVYIHPTLGRVVKK